MYTCQSQLSAPKTAEERCSAPVYHKKMKKGKLKREEIYQNMKGNQNQYIHDRSIIYLDQENKFERVGKMLTNRWKSCDITKIIKIWSAWVGKKSNYTFPF